MGNGEQVRAEWVTLVEDILRTPELVQAEICSNLLRILVEQSDNPAGISGKELADLLYKQKAHGDRDQAFRQLVMELRAKLRRYAASDEGQRQKWCCLLPNGISGQGYRLRFVNQWSLPGETGRFWQAHCDCGTRPMVVFTESLFFAPNSGSGLLDIGHEGVASEKLLASLKEPRPDVDRTALRSSHCYVASGEIKAQQVIQDWFELTSGASVTAHGSRRATSADLSSSSPILLGSPRDNKWMRDLSQLRECRETSYSFDCVRPGVILLKNPTADEKRRLALLPQASVREQDGLCELIDIPEANGNVFGILLRMPNPYGDGVVTVIGAHDARAVEQCAKSLTDDSRIRRLFANTAWSRDESAPEFFEALFSVSIGPASMDAEPRAAELIGYRPVRCMSLANAPMNEGENRPAAF
jgi:hypothetical protein